MRRETVLVADDDENCRRQCRTALEAASFKVIEAPDGLSALSLARSDPELKRGFDLALLDYMMPGRDGFATFRELRQEQADLAGILLTGNTSLSVAIEALNRGFSQVVAKPLDPPALVDAVEAALAERRTMLDNVRLLALTRLYDQLNQMASLTEPAALHSFLVDLAVTEIRAERVSLMLVDERTRALRVVASTGLSSQVAHEARREIGEPISGWVFSRQLTLELAPDKPLPAVIRAAMRRPEVTASMCLPLCAAGEPVGVLNISRLDAQKGFQPGDVEVATILASDAALTLHRLTLLQERARRERVATAGRLASSIIHDLRGPVTVISAAAEMIEDDLPETGERLDLIRREVGELEKMCTQLLSFARSNAAPAFDEVPVAALLAEVATEAAPTCAQAGVLLVLGEAPERCVEAARGELRSAVLALVEAACDGVAAGSTVHLSASETPTGVEIRVAGEMPQAAHWWQDLEVASGDSASGAALTLAISRHVTERHRGQLDVRADDSHYRVGLHLPRSAAAPR